MDWPCRTRDARFARSPGASGDAFPVRSHTRSGRGAHELPAARVAVMPHGAGRPGDGYAACDAVTHSRVAPGRCARAGAGPTSGGEPAPNLVTCRADGRRGPHKVRPRRYVVAPVAAGHASGADSRPGSLACCRCHWQPWRPALPCVQPPLCCCSPPTSSASPPSPPAPGRAAAMRPPAWRGPPRCYLGASLSLDGTTLACRAARPQHTRLHSRRPSLHDPAARPLS